MKLSNKRISGIFFILFVSTLLVSLFAFAQQQKFLQIFRNGEIINEYPIEEIDYIEVNDMISAPDAVNASVSDKIITIKWNPVEGATYNVYRSADNVNFTLLASDIETPSFTDDKPLCGSNYYRVKAVIDGKESEYSTTACATLTTSEMESGIYLGVSGFNQSLYDYPITLLSNQTASGYKDFINGLTMKNGTLLYYSVDRALNAMQSAELPSDVTTAAIVTFTDGLDQGSMMKDVPYENDVEYLDGLNKRLKIETVAGIPITAYSIGLRGSDVSDISMFRSNLAKLSYDPNDPDGKGNAFEVSNMIEVNTKFKEIAEHLSSSTNLQTITIKIPGLSNGTLVRFTFDNVSNCNNSHTYIEGRFNLKNRSLEDVKYVGLKSTSGPVIKGNVEDIFVSFRFDDVVTDNDALIKGENTDEWTYIASNSSWQKNSEFDKTDNTEIITEKSSAVIMLVLDCSSSLSNDFGYVKSNAVNFIGTLSNAIQSPVDPAVPHLYITGSGIFGNGEWNAETPDEFIFENGEYVAEIKGLSAFKISTECGDWDTFNSGVYGCDYGDKPGGTVALERGWDANIKCPWKGDYRIVVSGDLRTIILTTESKKPKTHLYVRGDMNGWGAEDAWELEEYYDNVWRLVLDNNQSISVGESFKIADAYWGDLDFGCNGMVVPLEDEYQVYNGLSYYTLSVKEYFNGVLWLVLDVDGTGENYLYLSNDKTYVPACLDKWNSAISVTEFLSGGAPPKGNGIPNTYVKGYVVGIVNGSSAEQANFQTEGPFTLYSNIVIADSSDETDLSRCIPVQLVSTTDTRAALNLGDNPVNLGHQVIIEGTREIYMNVPGLKAAASYKWVGGTPNPGGEDDNPVTDNEIYTGLTAGNHADWTIDNGYFEEGISYVWKWDESYNYMKASAYVSGTRYATDARLISPVIDLTNYKDCEFSATNIINYANGKVAEYCKTYVQPEGEDLVLVDLQPMPVGNTWQEKIEGKASLKAFDGKKIRIIFNYISTTYDAATWEVYNVKVQGTRL